MTTEKPAKKNFLNWRKLLKKTARLARAGWKKMCKPFKQDDKLEKELKPLENKTSRTEKYVKLGTALLAAAGSIGTVISTIINESISSAQQVRIIDFVNELYSLYEKQNIEIEKIKQTVEKILSNNGIELIFEIALRSSAETNSNIKHHCYAEFIFNAVENKKLEDSRNEKLLRMLSELTEEEIILLISFSQPKVLGYTSEFDEKYEEIIMPKSRADHIPENDIHNAFRDEYILTLDQKGLITVALKNNGTKLPISTKDISITDYGSLLVESIYDEDFFGNVLR